jgi:hypothetical protein
LHKSQRSVPAELLHGLLHSVSRSEPAIGDAVPEGVCGRQEDPVQLQKLLIMVAGCATLVAPRAAIAASSKGCEGGGFSVLGVSGDRVSRIIPAAQVPMQFLVKGRYVEFSVDADTFGVRNWTLTGAANPLDITGGQRTIVFLSKIPNHGTLSLTNDVAIDIDGDGIELSRTGPGLSMKLQAKDCANGGVFQMEPQRADGQPTVVTHVLGDGVFYFDNPAFRDHLGESFPCVGCNGAVNDTVTVTARINFANDVSPKFVGRDSPQVATRIVNDCANQIPNPTHPGSVSHCGGVSQWSVASGGRMGQVMGEDATEVAPAATNCTQNCQAQNRIRGRATVLGFGPFPVADAVRLKPRFFPGFVFP